MLNFVHSIPTQIYFGQGQVDKLPEVLNRFGKKVLLTYGGGSIKKIGLYDKVMSLLNENGFTVIECGGIEPNPRVQSVDRGAALCKEHHVDVVLAVGGGSTIDASKAICVGACTDEDMWSMIKAHTTRGRKALPLVDILTLSATGSEFDSGAVISNMETNEKLSGGFTFPAVSICDPTYTYSVNKYQTAAGSADIMSHIMEGYFSRTDDVDLSDGICEVVLKSVIKNLPIALAEPDNYVARGNLMMCSSIGCSGVPEYGKQATYWPAHCMEHELSAYYDITHGVGLAILTPRWMRYIIEKDPTCIGRFVTFAKNVWGLDGDDDKALALAGVDALENFFKENGIPMTLTELGIDDTHFEAMAEHCNGKGRLLNAFVSLTVEDVVNIFKACL